MATAERPPVVIKESDKLTQTQKEQLQEITKSIFKRYERDAELRDSQFIQESVENPQEYNIPQAKSKPNERYEIAEDSDHYMKWLIDTDKSMLDNPHEGLTRRLTEEELLNLPDELFNELFIFKMTDELLNMEAERREPPKTADLNAWDAEGRDNDLYINEKLAWLHEPVVVYDCESDTIEAIVDTAKAK